MYEHVPNPLCDFSDMIRDQIISIIYISIWYQSFKDFFKVLSSLTCFVNSQNKAEMCQKKRTQQQTGRHYNKKRTYIVLWQVLVRVT